MNKFGLLIGFMLLLKLASAQATGKMRDFFCSVDSTVKFIEFPMFAVDSFLMDTNQFAREYSTVFYDYIDDSLIFVVLHNHFRYNFYHDIEAGIYNSRKDTYLHIMSTYNSDLRETEYFHLFAYVTWIFGGFFVRENFITSDIIYNFHGDDEFYSSGGGSICNVYFLKDSIVCYQSYYLTDALLKRYPTWDKEFVIFLYAHADRAHYLGSKFRSSEPCYPMNRLNFYESRFIK